MGHAKQLSVELSPLLFLEKQIVKVSSRGNHLTMEFRGPAKAEEFVRLDYLILIEDDRESVIYQGSVGDLLAKGRGMLIKNRFWIDTILPLPALVLHICRKDDEHSLCWRITP